MVLKMDDRANRVKRKRRGGMRKAHHVKWKRFDTEKAGYGTRREKVREREREEQERIMKRRQNDIKRERK